MTDTLRSRVRLAVVRATDEQIALAHSCRIAKLLAKIRIMGYTCSH
jgi:hypothetical protein